MNRDERGRGIPEGITSCPACSKSVREGTETCPRCGEWLVLWQETAVPAWLDDARRALDELETHLRAVVPRLAEKHGIAIADLVWAGKNRGLFPVYWPDPPDTRRR